MCDVRSTLLSPPTTLSNSPFRALKQFLPLHVKANCDEFAFRGVWTIRLVNATMHIRQPHPSNKSRERNRMSDSSPLVSVIMGSKSDWDTLRHADEVLTQFGVAHECRIVSAHRTPLKLAEFAAEAEQRGVEVVIAGAGGAAHLPGMAAAQTILPVLGVPVESHALKGLDSLLSIVQMPAGVPVGTLAIGRAGAVNAALLAIGILANSRPELREKLRKYRAEQTQRVLGETLP